jgi:flavin-dependent dehydrogenase
MRKVIVVGGGTAGWLTSFFIKKQHPTYQVTTIDSTKIGILGAGEGSTLILRRVLLEHFGFDEDEFISKVNGTKKHGIVFEGWNKKTDYSFVHGFDLDGVENESEYAYHFDAHLFADYLKEKSVEIGVTHIDNVVVDFEKQNNKISKLIFEDNTTIDSDFVFDCSGFKRLLIGNHYKSEWISYEDELIVNTALPFTLPPIKQKGFSKTIAKADDFGWIWNIPLQTRTGCGYIFSDEFSSLETIESRIKELYGDETKIGNPIKFESGSYKKVWIENVIAIGLSGGFLEPLEATSIMTTIFQLLKLPNDLFSSHYKEVYNDYVNSLNFQNMMFIRHHYNCSREDTDFWKEYKSKSLPTELIEIYNSDNKEEIYDILNIIDKQIIFRQTQYNHIHKNNFIIPSII